MAFDPKEYDRAVEDLRSALRECLRIGSDNIDSTVNDLQEIFDNVVEEETEG